MFSDLRFALRQLAKSPGFAAVAILSLALGIGANTAIFSLVNAVLLRSLPVKNPDELVLFRYIEGPRGTPARAGENNGFRDPATGRFSSTSFSIATFERFRAESAGLADVFAYAPFNQVNLLIDRQPETAVLGQFVSGTYFSGLGVNATLGRLLTPADDQPSAAPAVVISDRFWETRFARDPGVLGQTVLINKVPATIVGVTAPGFAGAMQIGESADFSVPLALHTRFQPGAGASRAQPWYWWIRVMGRLAPGATAAQAGARLEPVLQTSAREGWLAGRSLSSATEGDMPGLPALALDPGGQGENDRRRQYAQSLHVLTGLVGLVLLAACANVANLLLARGIARRREIALRLALGASRARIVRQLLAESLLLGFFGATLGLLLAWWSRGLLLTLRQFGGAVAVLDLSLDGRVLAFTVATAIATAVGFGLAPALRATHLNLIAEFQGSARALGTGARSRLGQTLMVVQIALSLVLLVGCGLFVRTLRNLQNVDPGFNPHQLVLFRLDLAAAGYTRDQFAALQARLQERFEQIPGVRAATYSRVALLGDGRANRRVVVPGYTPAPGESSLNINVNGLAPNFFAAMEIPLLLGRAFTDHDDASAPKVAIVNQAFAKKFFGRENPVGRRLAFSGAPTFAASTMEIVGLVRNAHYTGLRENPPPTIYLPSAQMPDGIVNFALRAAGPAAAIFPAIREAVREIDSTLPVINLRTEDEQIDRLSEQERLLARLSGFFGAIALTLACVGLYGLMSYQVLRRTGEIGLRMALGALPAHVLRMILRESLALVILGVLMGAGAALGATRWIASLLFGLPANDPLTYVGVALLLLAVAAIACLLPARRAAKVDPMTALRTE